MAMHDVSEPIYPYDNDWRTALACSAAIAAINITMRDRLWEQAAEKGAYLSRNWMRLQ